MFYFRVAGVAALLAAGCSERGDGLPACEIAPVEAGALRAVGTRILDQHDRVIALRGVNTGGRSKFAPYAPFEFDVDADGDYDRALADYLDRAAGWGVNVLRVPFSWQALEPERDVYDEAYLARYDALLDGAWARGMWTIVEFHQDVYAEGFCGDGFPAWTLAEPPPPPRHDCPSWFDGYTKDERVIAAFDALWGNDRGVRDELEAMWAMMAARHADRPGVIGYEIMNEPSEGSANLSAWAKETLTPFYSDLIALLQAEDPDALVLFDATGFDGVLARTDLDRPDGDNIVFAPHYYQPGALFGGGVVHDVMSPLSRWADQGAAWEVPVLLGEFGIAADHDEAVGHMRRQLDALDALGMHGTWWEYSVSHELWNDEDLSVVDGDGNERAVLDGVVRPYASAIAGDPEPVRYDADHRVLEVRYAPAPDGVSELVLPARIYPRGGRVTGQGACIDRDGDRVRLRAEPGAALVDVRVEPR